MKNKLFLSNVRKIKSSYKRFLSLLLLSFLGVGFFCGIKGSSPDMMDTIDKYYKDNNVYDIEIVSSTGFMEQDKNTILSAYDFLEVVGVKSTDELVTLRSQERTMKISSLHELNQVEVIEGRMPLKENEIVLEENVKKDFKLELGSTIKIPSQVLKTEEFTIVGYVKSPIYFSSFRGTTTIGNGELNYYSYVIEDAFFLPYYTSINIALDTDFMTNSEEYFSLVDEVIEKIKTKKIDNTSIWYYFTREDNPAYSSFIDATKSLASLGSVFPILFYFIAILISLISMTRMVMEDRGEIGTLKALGFSKLDIMIRYLFYAFCATSIGGILGAIVGFAFIPKIIWSIYAALFDIPGFVSKFQMPYFVIGMCVSIGCIVGATILSSLKVLREKSSELMRPASPPSGKKIFLEYTPFWKHFRFSNKITLRNIFRYKKRVLVTIIGITGSTALLLIGFGVKDSVYNLVDYHFHKIFVYDAMIRLTDTGNVSEVEKLLTSNSEVTSIVPANYQYIELYNKNHEKREVNFIVPLEKEEISDVIKLNDVNQKKEITLESDKIVLSEKLASLLEVKAGSFVELLIDGVFREIEVSHITENYFQDYAYMTRDTYEKYFGSFHANVIFMKQSDTYSSNFDKTIQKDKNVSNVVRKRTTSSLMEDVLDSLNSVIIVLLLSSAILAFVILYNISNINISERKREISTLKVLGYYDREVDAYITKENYLITVVGILLGLVLGFYLSHYIISTCEPDYMMFSKDIKWKSFVYASLISFGFTILVSFLTHFSLKKIDMVESLKSVE